MILKLRFGKTRTRLVEVAHRNDASGSGIGWRVDSEGKRFESQEIIAFQLHNIICEMKLDRPHGELIAII